MYDFSTQYKLGRRYEGAVALLFSKTYDVAEADREAQRTGVDYYLTHRPSGKVISVEVKMDFASHRTSNVAIEVLSIVERLKLGWGVTSQADYLVYGTQAGPALDGRVRLYIAKMSRVRSELQGWARDYGMRVVRNEAYHSLICPVPLKRFESICNDMKVVRLEGVA